MVSCSIVEGLLCMLIEDVRVLKYESRLLGLRFFTSDGAFDAEWDVLRKVGIYNINIDNSLQLKPVGDLLLSDEEASTGVLATDISENIEFLTSISGALQNTRFADDLFRVHKPHEIPLQVFMDDEGWVATKVDRTDEYKNQHNLTLPDGSKWRGGWIGSAKSPEIAKRNFHKEECMWSIHRGTLVSDEVLAPYSDLMEVKDVLNRILDTISIEDGQIHMRIGGETKSLPVSEYPLHSRIEERGVVRENNLISDVVESSFKVGHFDPRELTVIALTIALRREQDLLNLVN